MRILLLGPLPPPTGGIASWTCRYRKYCKKERISLRIVNTAIQGKRAYGPINKRYYFSEIKRTISIISRLNREIKKYKPSVIHLNTSCSLLGMIRDTLCIISVFRRAPVILHCRCNVADQLRGNRISIKIFSFMVRKSSKVIVLNSDSKNVVEKLQGGKSVLIPNFIDDEYVCESHAVKDRIERVIYVGHIEKAKGIVQIAEAASLLPDIEFVALGSIREDLSNIQIPSNLHMVGTVPYDKVNGYLIDSDVFLLPSLSEGFSNALLEAMATGLPIIASDVGANYDMIENNGGVILSEISGKCIAEAISLIGSKEERIKMSNWNIKKTRRKYVISRVMNRYLSLYLTVEKERDCYS